MPYGAYDIAAYAGWVSVGIDHDTAAFAVNSISAGGTSSAGHAMPRPPAGLDQNRYAKGIIVSDAEMATINITRANFHGDWNCAISPARNRPLIL